MAYKGLTMVEITESSSPASTSRPAFKESNSFLTADGHNNPPEFNHQPPETAPPAKRKRNLAGMPDPDAEVIALSPKTLLATNRFVCEICNKGFQRDQNLQLHRRGHNLPWKLRQRGAGEAARRRVYVCPVPTCAHHDPSRALGDLTGIRKHFCRKHGEKKFRCDRCSKNYAVCSDWKAHVKTCGSREYRCDCGTLFSRRDIFITHRAFCEALTRESSMSRPPESGGGDSKAPAEAFLPPVEAAAASPPPPPLTPPTGVLSPVMSVQSSAAELPENKNVHLQPAALTTSIAPAALTTSIAPAATTTATGSCSSTASGNFPATLSPSTSETPQSSINGPASFPGLLCPISGPIRPATDPMSLSLSPSFYGPFLQSTPQNHHHHYLQGPQPALSATALLQKAAQMGSTSSGSFISGLGLGPTSPSGPQSGLGLGLGLGSGGSSGLHDMMMGPSIFVEKPTTTLDFLGLGMEGADQSQPAGFSAFLSLMSGDGLRNMGGYL
ncbi:C2H2-like zinc finger protein [Striga asiatica]|uniref:C2H2-like zinc finger protein n=1 Tax=Striga asiatica TaxID=4170 RepID=A0A5A7PY92_STRAF|nr:C2H2-like zinc finger protein [Striga asiatica]